MFYFHLRRINDPSPSLFKQSLSHYQLYLGDIYFTKNDKNKARKFYLLSAYNENAEAQAKIGSFYINGNLYFPKDYELAMKWLLKSSSKNNPTAQFYIGYMYDDGLGVIQNYYTAIEWYLKSAEQNFSRAQNNLGLLYLDGLGTKQDYEKQWSGI